MFFIFYILLFTFAFTQTINCPTENLNNNRSVYSIGDTISEEDQNITFPICNGSGDYSTGDSFSFADLNGDLNGGDYKITVISMNATW